MGYDLKSIGTRIVERRKKLNISRERLSKITSIPLNTLQRLETAATKKVDINKINSIATALGVSTTYILTGEELDLNIDNILPLRSKQIPLLGTIAAGQPIYADEDIKYCLQVTDDIDADFCLKVKGDSMINARIHDGDIVFVRKQPDVLDGEIAAVLIDDEATLKRVYKMPGRVQLRAENPKYAPMDFYESEGKNVTILGKAIAFQSNIV